MPGAFNLFTDITPVYLHGCYAFTEYFYPNPRVIYPFICGRKHDTKMCIYFHTEIRHVLGEFAFVLPPVQLTRGMWRVRRALTDDGYAVSGFAYVCIIYRTVRSSLLETRKGIERRVGF